MVDNEFGLIYDKEWLPLFKKVNILSCVDLSETIETRPNGSTRSKDHTQMTTLLYQNEHNDSTYDYV